MSRTRAKPTEGAAKSAAKSKKPYVEVKNFKIDEILRIHKAYPNGWMSLDKDVPEQTETMKKHDSKYIDIFAPSIDEKGVIGEPRKLYLEMTPARTKSLVSGLTNEDGKMPSSVSFQLRVKCLDLTDKALDDKLEELANKVVDEKFPGIPDDEFSAKVDQQKKLLELEHKQELAHVIIAREFERYLELKETQKSISWIKKKNQNVQSNVQFARAHDPKIDKVEPDENGCVKLEEPIIRIKIQVGKPDGDLWCKIYDITEGIPAKGTPRKLAKYPDADGKMKDLDYNTVTQWLTPDSVFTGNTHYQLCICKDGARLHEKAKELNVKRAARQAGGKPKITDDALAAMEAYGGVFESATKDESKKDEAKKEKPAQTQDKEVASKIAALADDDD